MTTQGKNKREWAIVDAADCEGDWFDGDISTWRFSTEKAALAAACKAYRGEDEYGNRAWFAAVPVEEIGSAGHHLALARACEKTRRVAV